jgi:UrcA family protein
MKTSIKAALVAAFVAFGASVAEARSTRVQLANVDYSNPQAVLALHDRIVDAARNVCRDQGLVGLAERAAQRACVVEAVKAAIAAADRSALTAAHDALPTASRYATRAPLTPDVVAAVAATGQSRAELRLSAPLATAVYFR